MKRLLKWALVFCGVVLLLLAAAISVLRSGWFRDRLKTRIVAEVEQATGGKTEIGSFAFDWTALTATVDGFVLRGREENGRPPFLSVKSIALGLAVDSWIRREIKFRRLTVERPELHIYVAADGQTNIPHPVRAPSKTTFAEDLIQLRIGELAITDGYFEFDSRSAPFSVRANGVALDLALDPAPPRYGLKLSLNRIELPTGYAPSVNAHGWLENTRVLFDDLRLEQRGIKARIQGELADFRNPSIDGKFTLSGPLADFPQCPVREGSARGEGSFRVKPGGEWLLNANVNGDGLAWRSGDIALTGIRIAAAVRLNAEVLALDSVSLSSPLGAWSGSARLEGWRHYELTGEFNSLAVGEIQRAFLKKPYQWEGAATGPVRLSGEFSSGGPKRTLLDTQLAIVPAEGQLPVEGLLDLRFDQEAGEIEFGTSHLQIGSSRMNFTGTLGRRLEIGLFSSRIKELEPLFAMILDRESFTIPVGIRSGEARIEATIIGDLKDPRAEGKLALTNAGYEGLVLERLDAAFQVSRGQARLSQLRAIFEKARLDGRIQLGLSDWKPDLDAPFNGQITFASVDLERAARLFGKQAFATGVAGGTVNLSGVPGAPSIDLRARLDNAAVGVERFKSVEGQLRLDGSSGNIEGSVQLDAGAIRLEGAWLHPHRDFTNGAFDLRLDASGFALNSLESIAGFRPGLAGAMEGKLALRLSLENGDFRLRGVDGSLRSPSVSMGTRSLGAFSIAASTKGHKLEAKLRLELPDAPVEGAASVELDGDYASEGTLQIPGLSFGLVHDLFSPGPDPTTAPAWPVRGTLAGTVSWKAPLAQPAKGTARVTVSELQVFPRTEILPEMQVKAGSRTLRNSGPLVFDVDATSLKIHAATLTALDTNVAAKGALSWRTSAAWNVDVAGTMDLSALGIFQPNLIAAGSAKISAGLRGSLADPQLSGRMEIVDGSFFLKDVPNGIEKANGMIRFEKGRAIIEKLTGQTGGGEFAISGFVGVNKDQILYRLQANGKNIRVRYPEGVSTTADASLTLAGSPVQSQLSGSVTILRASFQGQGDLGSAVGSSGNPIPAAAARNDFLRNLQFDVRIRTAADMAVHSSYTQDLETEADLRLRGSPSKPILLGSVKVNQGGVQFFGNRYTVSRGEITFFNTAVVQPVVDLDLETRVRGITVFINVNGPLSRLNVNYRSEPPLQSNEILALLTVGRTPVSASSSIPASPVMRSQTVLENSPNSLLGAALSATVSGRMERFFGATRMKIDPQVTGVENVNSARLSIEQSLSRDITLTYIMNLSRTQQQIVRIEWDVSRQWQMIAVRDENGVFAVDFVFRKRFK